MLFSSRRAQPSTNSPAPREPHIPALAPTEDDNDPGTTFTPHLEGGRCILIFSAGNQETCTAYQALRGTVQELQ